MCKRASYALSLFHSPTLSLSKDGGIRTHAVRLPRPADSPLSYVLSQSAQRELNPRILHGKQVGYRYITGACQWDPRDSNPHHAG